MIKASVIGATGYSGIELVRLLTEHPEVQISLLTSQTYEGLNISDIYPHLTGSLNCKLENLDIDKIVEKSDVIFVALPHGLSAEIVEKAYKKNKKVIDLGADFRLDSADDYEKWYQTEHKAKDLLKEKVYGLPELNREKIKNTFIVANPGCYPTSVILGLFPALKEGIISPDDIIIDSKSGVSGAGRNLSVGNLYATCNESISAYKIASHRHTPEIAQELSKIVKNQVNLLFTPHLTPMTRGILSTIYVKLKEDLTTTQIRNIYEKTYQDELFVKVLEEGIMPQTKWTAGTNNCFLNLKVDECTKRLVIVSAIDNLLKGASGQAIQNMNLLFGLNEKTGLNTISVYP